VGHALVTIPVPEADALLRSSPADPTASISLLGPLEVPVDETDAGPEPGSTVGRWVADLADFFADVTPFRFTLTGVHRFPGGGLYLAPDPAAPFRQLGHALHQRLGRSRHTGGFGESVPHVSVPVAAAEDPSSVEGRLTPLLPLPCLARSATLVVASDDARTTVATFRFGTTAA
jgi:hypothetical protein